MTAYEELIKRLYATMRFIDPSLNIREEVSYEISRKIDESLGRNSSKMPIVHIAGTNGKGSVAHKIAESARHANLKVGLFTSPHIHSFTERIKINSQNIPEEDFIHYADLVFAAVQKLDLKANFFEYLCNIALLYFAEKKVDLAIIEVGIGGKLDTTNFLTPILSIITSISYDHIPFLGKDLKDIAEQKSGIIKENIPVVLGPSAQVPIILDVASQKNAPVIFSMMDGGFFDDENMDIAAVSLKELSKHFPIADLHICQGVRGRPIARFEVIPSFLGKKAGFEKFPEHLVIDVAHNVAGIERLIEAIKIQLPAKKLRFLLSFSKGKDASGFLKIVSNHASHVHIPNEEHFKLAEAEKLAETLHNTGFENVSLDKNLHESFLQALKEASEKEEILVVCGTFYIMSEIREKLKLADKSDRFLTNRELLSMQK